MCVCVCVCVCLCLCVFVFVVCVCVCVYVCSGSSARVCAAEVGMCRCVVRVWECAGVGMF